VAAQFGEVFEELEGIGKKLDFVGTFIKIAPKNPVLWTGMKGASAKGRKNWFSIWEKFTQIWKKVFSKPFSKYP
jgi:hypothetical protein